ncbi:RNA polymerase sigma factor [Frankia sp. AvcI1]|uniref:RNA polymerase sigma factor n=1 Tax=Frankia sp. AvcI1 TaxID=573496 RepID=UPI002119672C|nr:sigma-70 family RNA polymerase sigma factor [Frankia sp. AvcI1]
MTDERGEQGEAALTGSTGVRDTPSGQPLGRPEPLEQPEPAAVVFEDFYQEFTPTLVAFLLWQGARLADAADIVQETMTTAYRRWTDIKHPRAWTRTVASREYVRRIASVEDPVGDLSEVVVLLPANGDLAAFEQRHEVLRLLKLLPHRQRQVMAWAFLGYTPAETADELKISSDAVRSTLKLARRALAQHLAGGRSDDD